MIPRRLAAGGKELTSDLPASPNQPQVPGSPHYSPSREPLASLSTGSLPACIPAQPPTSFICSQGADSQQTTLGPAPVCNSVQRLRVGCKSPHGHRVGQGPRAPPIAGGHWLLCLGCGHTKAGPHSRNSDPMASEVAGPPCEAQIAPLECCSCGPAQDLCPVFSYPSETEPRAARQPRLFSKRSLETTA